VAIRTPLTELFDLKYPIVLAPMGAVSGGALAAAVSNAGGLGFVGGGYGDQAWLERELEIATAGTRRKWGVGLITWAATDSSVELALRYRPDAFFLSFGDGRSFVPAIADAGCVLICQIQDVEEAVEATAMGADVVVAQGAEAGGHGAVRATLPLVPAVVDAVGPTPVLAAGGIGDGRGVAAALALGAAGALIGTRFCVSEEALMHLRAKRRIISSRARETRRTRVFDIVREYDWPAQYTGRALRNQFLEKWHEGDATLGSDTAEKERYRSAAERADFDTAVVWAGESVDLVDAIEPASTIVERIGSEAERWLRHAPTLAT
jgi:nitronate monooxygenase